jgi:aryl-alcohol dehydrogenase-like predicted oxidoreductase
VKTAIIGATRIEHIEHAVEALDINLSSDEIQRLEEPYKPHIIIGHS